MSPQAWIFQSSPDQYDLPAALSELREFTWLANQSPNEIRPGDRVYLWETGHDAGILAVGTILTGAAQLEESDQERKFSRRSV